MSKKVLIMTTLVFYFFSFFIGTHTVSPTNLRFSGNLDDFFPPISEISTSHVLLENSKVITLLILGGFMLGIPTFINIFSNGYFLGVIFSVYSRNLGVKKFLLHGIFEIPAIIIAGAAGFKIPYEIIRYLAGKKEQILTKEDIKEYLALALISIILIVIAAWIEANITLRIAETMLNSTKDI